MRRQLLYLGVFIVIALAALALFDRMSAMIGDGSIPFQIHFRSGTRRTISRVSHHWLVGHENNIPQYRNQFRTYKDEFTVLSPADDFHDNCFTAEMPVSEHNSLFGRRLSYTQLRILALKVEYADGTAGYEIVWLPEGRVQRSVVVDVP